MSYRKVLIILTACFVTVAVVSGTAVATDFTFIGTDDNTWNDPDNWDPGTGPPGPSDKAIIPPTETVTTDGEDVGCKILEIQRSDPNAGQLQITEGSTFTIYGGSSPDNDSIIHGFIVFVEHDTETTTPVLLFQNDVTLKGDKGGIGSSSAKGILIGSSDSVQLTIAKTGGNVFSVGSGSSDLDVVVELVNNAFVLSGVGTLRLMTNPKSGSGVWGAISSGGKLQVDVAVSGSGSWELPWGESSGSPEIEINAACTSLTGPVLVRDGTFDINANFWTTGEIGFRGGTIDVDGTSPISASFGQ
jgi:hypothetical protein